MRNIKFFDYIYYRTYVFFLSKGDNVPETKGSILLSIVQFFTLLTMTVIVRFFWEFPLPHKFYILPLILLIGVWNWYCYERNFEINHLDELWKDESPANKKLKGWLIAAYTAFVISFPMIIGYLSHSLGFI